MQQPAWFQKIPKQKDLLEVMLQDNGFQNVLLAILKSRMECNLQSWFLKSNVLLSCEFILINTGYNLYLLLSQSIEQGCFD